MDKFDIDNFLYEHIEFFFSTDDLKDMMDIQELSYENWQTTVVLLNETIKPKPNESNETNKDITFNYNIMTDVTYFQIKEILKTMKKDIQQKNKEEIKNKIIKIENLYDKLYYYDEVYVHAHFVFNNIRKLIKEGNPNVTMGGGMSLEDFKERIRQKIILITSQ
jgi:hypothetical protein